MMTNEIQRLHGLREAHGACKLDIVKELGKRTLRPLFEFGFTHEVAAILSKGFGGYKSTAKVQAFVTTVDGGRTASNLILVFPHEYDQNLLTAMQRIGEAETVRKQLEKANKGGK